jgi:putative PIN family toxin of toxin-antitoxin system
MRVVIDTNIIVSAYLGGALEAILKAFKAGKFKLIVSETIADEYFRVLRRPKFMIERDEFEDFVALLVSKAEFITPTEVITAIQTDPSDNKFLEAALEGKADYLVSGDNHLLELQIFREIPILTAHNFIEQLSSND